MLLDYFIGEAQPKTCTLTDFLGCEERIEYSGKDVLRNPFAIILNNHIDKMMISKGS